MEIFRIIYANNIEDIDFNNFGVHFSSNGERLSVLMMKNPRKFNREDVSGKKAFFFVAEVNEDQINDEATQISNEGYPEEFEVVLEMNTQINITEAYEVDELVDENMVANTGTNADAWVKKL